MNFSIRMNSYNSIEHLQYKKIGVRLVLLCVLLWYLIHLTLGVWLKGGVDDF